MLRDGFPTVRPGSRTVSDALRPSEPRPRTLPHAVRTVRISHAPLRDDGRVRWFVNVVALTGARSCARPC